MKINNHGEENYSLKLQEIADKLLSWQGPIVIISHVDPDGDALGSVLTLKRALDSSGKASIAAIESPSYLSFVVQDGELSAPLDTLPDNTLLVVLDVDLGQRTTGAPLEEAAFTINIDHHGTNPRTADLSCVEPAKAATALMIKELIDTMNLAWTKEIALPCLTGILTDTGILRYGNTTAEVLEAVADLMTVGVDYASLTDRLQWRQASYYQLLGLVLNTVDYPLDGLVVTAHMSKDMEAAVNKSDDDSNDYVGLIRYSEGTKVAVFFKESGEAVKLSMRTRDGISAQAICSRLGGGGHVAAAGAKLMTDLASAKAQTLESIRIELEQAGLL